MKRCIYVWKDICINDMILFDPGETKKVRRIIVDTVMNREAVRDYPQYILFIYIQKHSNCTVSIYLSLNFIICEKEIIFKHRNRK